MDKIDKDTRNNETVNVVMSAFLKMSTESKAIFLTELARNKELLDEIYDLHLANNEEPEGNEALSSFRNLVNKQKEAEEKMANCSLKFAESLQLDGPEDYSENWKEYVYGNKEIK